MFKAIHNIFIVAIILLAIVSQGFAAVSMPCEMPLDSHQTAMQHSSMMSASDHAMMQQQSSNQSSDCCDVECHCSTNACTSVTLIANNQVLVKLATFVEKTQHITHPQPQTQPKSLYRPPIFA